jgi:hypothetical protein
VGIPGSKLYSAVISSGDQPLAAVVTSKSENTPYRRMAYNATSQGDSTLFFPVIFKNYSDFNTALQIQNTSNSNATVSVYYYNQGGGLAASESAVVPAHGTHTFNQGTSGTLPDGSFSARVASNGPQLLVGIVNETRRPDVEQTHALNYTGFDGGSRVYTLADIARNSNGWNTALQIQNVGSGEATVTVSYYDGESGDPRCQNTVSIPALGWVQYNHAADQGQLGETCLAGQLSWSGSAVVTADQDVAVIVNETKSGMGGMSYNGSD